MSILEYPVINCRNCPCSYPESCPECPYCTRDPIKKEMRDIEFFIQKIKKGEYDVNVRDLHGKTPLISSITNQRSKYAAYLDLLLDLGADPNLADYFGATAFHWAIREDMFETAKIMIEYGANFNIFSTRFPIYRKLEEMIENYKFGQIYKPAKYSRD